MNNSHLNVFRFFNEKSRDDQEAIENNLSRAFSICLLSNGFFLNEYIQAIVKPSDYDYLFSTKLDPDEWNIDLQVDMATVEKDQYQTVYAISMTTDKDVDMTDFFKQTNRGERKNITDIFMHIKDIAFVIEVKRTSEDCKAQLYNQVLAFIDDKDCEVEARNFSWKHVVKLMERIQNVQHLMSTGNIFISDFLGLVKAKFPNWFEPKPFNVLHFSNKINSPEYIHLTDRMRVALTSSNYETLNNRDGIYVSFSWASEVVPEFYKLEDNSEEFVAFYIWPGNTKQQGYSIFNNPLDWQEKKKLEIDGNEYEIKISQDIKLSHFNGYVSSINFSKNDLKKPIHTKENFYNKSGKWNRDQWDEFESFLDDHFRSEPEFSWRERCDWKGNFLNTGRNYFTMSLGYEVRVLIKYELFKEMDKKEEDVEKVSEFINELVKSFEGLLN